MIADAAPKLDDFKRDRWGRPLIVPAAGGKALPYTRASSAAKTIEDTYNLELWARRNVAYGMAHDASLVARVLAVGGDPGSWTQDEKKAVNAIHEDAQKVAQSHKAADIGTAVHALTERLDRGETVVGGPYQSDLDAYTSTLYHAGHFRQSKWVECRMVCDALQIAGTADRIVVDRNGRHLIADIKTGPTVDFGGLGWAAQLACYAHSDLYDINTDGRLDTPPIDREVGIIIHLPAGRGICTLYEIDLVAGYRAAVLANEIRAIRKESKRWISPITPMPPAVEDVDAFGPHGDDAIEHAQPVPEIATAEESPAPSTVAPVDPAGVAPHAPAGSEPSRADVVAELGNDPVEGDWCADDFAPLQRVFLGLDGVADAWFRRLIAEANQASVGFQAQHQKTVRRYEIYRGLLHLAASGNQDDEVVRAIVAKALNTDAPLFPCITTGHAVGALDAVSAAMFSTLCVNFVDGRLDTVVDDDGYLRVAA